jgi:hypothetical protein
MDRNNIFVHNDWKMTGKVIRFCARHLSSRLNCRRQNNNLVPTTREKCCRPAPSIILSSDVLWTNFIQLYLFVNMIHCFITVWVVFFSIIFFSYPNLFHIFVWLVVIAIMIIFFFNFIIVTSLVVDINFVCVRMLLLLLLQIFFNFLMKTICGM